MEWIREAHIRAGRWSGILWRVAILVLPWQTRWFVERPLINGFSWEQGRTSVYASWILIAVVILLVYHASRDTHHATRITRHVLLIISFFLVTLFTTQDIRATIQWWAEIILLYGFVRATFLLQIPRQTMAAWVILSLVPHVGLGFFQWRTQQVFASSLLGIAGQNPLLPGVSVVEDETSRLLRAYGGFPHPNIFGGWLAFGLACVAWLSWRARRLSVAMLWGLIGSFFASMLVLTFSRSAWLAAIVGLLVFFARAFLQSKKRTRQRISLAIGGLLIVLGATMTGWLVRDAVLTRTRQSDSRLETRSLDERAEGWENGLALLRNHLWVGVGPGSAALSIVREVRGTQDKPPIVPHNIWLLALTEMGIIGFVVLLAILLRFFLRSHRKSLWLFGWPVVLMGVIMGFFDHYLWSYWSGHVLAALMVIFFLKQDEFQDKETGLDR